MTKKKHASNQNTSTNNDIQCKSFRWAPDTDGGAYVYYVEAKWVEFIAICEMAPLSSAAAMTQITISPLSFPTEVAHAADCAPWPCSFLHI